MQCDRRSESLSEGLEVQLVGAAAAFFYFRDWPAGASPDVVGKNETHQMISSDKVEGTSVFDSNGEKIGTGLA